MGNRTRYRKKAGKPVVAVQLALETDGFTYRKWGGDQRCEAKDWLVNNDGDVYTINRETFEATYRKIGPGLYEKSAPIWAEVADQPGTVGTKEGQTHYEAGWYLVSNNEDGTDAYAVDPEKFDDMYEPAP